MIKNKKLIRVVSAVLFAFLIINVGNSFVYGSAIPNKELYVNAAQRELEAALEETRAAREEARLARETRLAQLAAGNRAEAIRIRDEVVAARNEMRAMRDDIYNTAQLLSRQNELAARAALAARDEVRNMRDRANTARVRLVNDIGRVMSLLAEELSRNTAGGFAEDMFAPGRHMGDH